MPTRKNYKKEWSVLSLFSEFDGYSGVGKKLSWPITF